ncbi:MAG TPA: class I SAM-dependent methyltransferase [Xanthobacteraceae bacterium]|jgi:2-polyprenyl-3-methyl-5-hydroxy-6-metoxy-1,4-benzoquinol methylase|nr:class I SAM-dependent methyltransferase [Xanthobacteraceae bacterium]
MKKRDGEPQYEEVIAEMRRRGPEKLGLMSGWGWYDDPKRLAFTLSRYKFVSKMFGGLDHVLEVGCGDGFGSRVVAQSVGRLTAVDFDPELLESATSIVSDRYPIEFRRHNMLKGPVQGMFSGIYSMDVLEHIDLKDEDLFLKNLVSPLSSDGVCIIGTPSLESQTYASKFSKMGHVNCKTQDDLKSTMQRYFRNVFMFSMNDEVVHTGYSKMSHYNLALCCYPRR